jgi:hypothetical protein
MTSRDYLDEPIEVGQDHPLRLSAEGLRALKKATGRTLSDLLNDDEDEAARFQVLAFAELHRRAARVGHLPDAGDLWERAGVIELDFVAAERLDPLDAKSSTTSPPSPATGG